MQEQQPTLLERLRLPLAVAAAAGMIAVAGCSSPSGEQAGPSANPGSSQEASPAPSESQTQGDMANADDPQLSQLAGYESALHHTFGHEMYFTDMPRTVEEAQSQAAEMAGTLKEYAKYGVKPLIIMEPTSNDGGNIALDKLHTAKYGRVLHALFSGLKHQGVTDEEMGTLVPMPEADLPNWGDKPHSTSPTLFGKNYAAVSKAYRRAFPDGKLGLLLDSTAYPTGDINYEHGDTMLSSLAPYINAVERTPGAPQVDALMFQGFPFVAGSTAHEYLNGNVAVALAKQLGARTVWFNTGSAKHIDGHNVPAAQRREQLFGELAQAKIAKAAGDAVIFNVFGGQDPTVSWKYPLKDGKVAPPLADLIQTADHSGIDAELFVDGQ